MVAPKKRENRTAKARTIESVNTRMPGAFKAMVISPLNWPHRRTSRSDSIGTGSRAYTNAAGLRHRRHTKLMWVKWEGGARSRTTGVAEARTRNDHLDGTAGNIGMGYAHTHHPVVALSAGAFGERRQGAGDGLIE